MKYMILFISLMLFITNVYAVQTVTFNYEFNSSKSMAYSNIVKDDSVVLNVQTNLNSLYCKYSESGGKSFDLMEGTFDFSFQTLHKKSFSYMSEGVYNFYVKCRDENNSIGQESELTFSIINPVKAEIYLSKESPVSSGLIEITLKTTKQLSSKPTLSYSTDATNYNAIPLEGSNDLWTGYIIIPYSLKESIGSFKFRGIDLDGVVGEEITKGEIFLIDTLKPSQISEIDTEGKENKIYLEWRFNEDYSYFNIYKSKFPNVEYTDFYKKVDKKYYTDSDVEAGRTYYYKITAVDDAGNEGDLSYEVSSTPINGAESDPNELQNGLDPELMGSVDSFLYDIESVYSKIESAKYDFNSDSENKESISTLSLISEIESSKRELEALQTEIKGYKEQDITRVELEKKINNAKTKLNAIKKKTPESLSVVSKSEFSSNYDENSIREILISLGKNEDEINTLFKKSKEIMDASKFIYGTKAKNIEIYYMDGGKISKCIIDKEINTQNKNNGSIIEYIPKEVAESVSDIDFKESNYNVLKDDPIISLPSDISKLTYVLNKEVDIESVKKIKTFFLIEEDSNAKNSITGFSIFEKGLNSNSFVISVIIIMVLGLILYFNKSKKERKDIELLNVIGDRLAESKLYIETKNYNKLNEIYMELSEHYKKLSEKSKSLIYGKLTLFHKQIKSMKLKK